jgi:indolepyruvate ferredoxin oxidoreductase alpha subunit
MLEPSDSAEALEFAKLAYEISETFDTPVLLKMCTRVAHSQSVVPISERKVPIKDYEKNIAKYVMMPGNAKKRHPFVEERTKKLTEYAENCPLNRVEMGGTELGIITCSTSYQYVKEVFGDKVSVLKLGMTNPLPVQLVRDFASQVKNLVVVEELDPIIENHVKALGIPVHGKDLLPMIDEFSQNLIAEKIGQSGLLSPEDVPALVKTKGLSDAIPPRPPVMCAGCPHRGLFYTLKKNKCTVLGDIGCYTLGAVAPLSTIEMTLCMGASIGAVHGFNKVLGAESEGKTVAVIGDSTFMHSGMTGLANVAYNQSNSTVIILDNSITGMTGHQQNPTTGYNIKGDPAGKIDLEALCRAMGFERVRVVDPYDLGQCDKVLKEELAAEAPSVIISRRPCALLKYVKHKPALKVDSDKCIGCKSCMRIGCPAISMKAGSDGKMKAVIDTTLCVGCGVCQQLCPTGALMEGGNA